MPVQIIRQDITKMQVDAIVASSNNQLMPGSGENGAIHAAAGPGLREECRQIGGCGTGQAVITRGYDLPARYIIHTVGPVWRSGWYGEETLLASCYRSCLQLARENVLQSIAFPIISAGIYGYPREDALRVGMNAIRSFLMESDDDMMVYLVVFDKETVAVSSRLFRDVQQFIDDRYAEENREKRRRQLLSFGNRFNEPWDEAGERSIRPAAAAPAPSFSYTPSADENADVFCESREVCAPLSLEDELEMIDESFAQMVLRLISEKGMKNAECYKKANLDKKLFSKINNDIHYRPKKTTALALAIALELDLEETKELLMKAGLALSRSDKFDIIVEYFIREKKYDIFELNEVLFYYDQPLLGCVVA